VLVGDGKEKASLQQLAHDLGLQNVIFVPSVAKTEMKKVLAAADACLAILKPIELYKTTYPNKVFDYLAAGRPVLCAIDGVIREVIEEAHAGIFVPPGDPAALADAVIRLSSAPDKGKKMGLNGRAYVVEHFNRRDIAARMEKVLFECANNPR